MDALLAPTSLFSDAMNSVVERFQEAREQAMVAEFQRHLPS